MKIVQFINNLVQGGAEAVVREYALELKKRGHDVQIITLFPFVNSNNELILKENNIVVRSIFDEIYKIKSYCFFMRAIRKPFKVFRVDKWLRQYINDFQPDIIHIHLSLLNYFIKLKKELVNTRLFFTCHSEADYYFGKNNQKDIEIVKQLIRDDNLHVIALHEKMQKELKERFLSDNVTCLPNPIDLEKFRNPSYNKSDMRKKIGIPENAFVIGHNGRFTDAKNHEFLINVFNSVKNDDDNAFLLMIGSGELKDSIINKLNSMGLEGSYLILSDRRDIPELLNTMDVFVFPSSFEGLGIALIEAEAVGLPCIVSNKVPKLAIVGNKTITLGIDPDDIANWKNAVLNKDNIKSEYYGNIESFDIHYIVNRLEELYKK